MYKQPSKSASGGVVIYVNDKLNHSRLEEFSVTEKDFESLWIEISNKKNEKYHLQMYLQTPKHKPYKNFRIYRVYHF